MLLDSRQTAHFSKRSATGLRLRGARPERAGGNRIVAINRWHSDCVSERLKHSKKGGAFMSWHPEKPKSGRHQQMTLVWNAARIFPVLRRLPCGAI